MFVLLAFVCMMLLVAVCLCMFSPCFAGIVCLVVLLFVVPWLCVRVVCFFPLRWFVLICCCLCFLCLCLLRCDSCCV